MTSTSATTIDIPAISHETAEQLAKHAIQLIIGSDNEYLQKLLTDKLEGKIKDYSSVPVIELFKNIDRQPIKETLTNAISTLQPVVVDALVKNPTDINNIQPIASWILNTILQEKLNYREVRETSDKWKNINGILAIVLPIVLPIITNLLQYFLFNKYSQSSM